MLPFVASQAVALSQARRDASKASANGQQNATPRTGKGFFSKLLGGLVEFSQAPGGNGDTASASLAW